MRSILLAFLLCAGCFDSSGFASDDEERPDSDEGVRTRDGAVDSRAPDTAAPLDTAPAPPAASSDADYCVQVVNSYRAKIGAAPLTRSPALEAFAMKAAESDGKSGRPHGYFSSTSGGGIAWAENEIPGWPGEIRKVIAEGTEMMWDEGPGGGHHDNIASRKWKEVGCGIYVTASKKVWVTQDFR